MPSTFGTTSTSVLLPGFSLPQFIPISSQSFKDLLSMYCISYQTKSKLFNLVHMVFAKNSSPSLFPDLFFIAPSMNTSTNHAIYQPLNILLLPILHIQQLVLNCPITVQSTPRVKLNKTMFPLQGIYNFRRKLVVLPPEIVNSLEQKHCLK